MSRAEIFRGNLRAETQSAPAELVADFQRDLARVAFALTGDPGQSAALVRDAFIAVLTGPADDEADPNTWARLLVALGRGYLAGADIAPLPDVASAEGLSIAERERLLLRGALLLLARPMRAALVLRDLGGLNAHDAALLTGIEPVEFEPLLDRSRERIREGAGGPAGESSQRLLSTLALDAPRLDLWPDIRPVVEEHAARRRARNRRIAAATLVLTLAGALAVTIWFAGGLSALGGSDAEPTAPSDAALIPDSLPTRPPRPAATPTPTPTAVELIDAVLPGELQLVGYLFDEESRGTGEQVTFNFDPDAEQPFVEAPVSDVTILYTSPDGRWTVLQRSRQQAPPDAERPEDAPPLPVLSVARDGVELDWEFEVPFTSYHDSWDSAVLGDRLYVAYAPQRAPTIVVLELETGAVIESLSLDLPLILPVPEPGEWSPSVQVRLFPFAGADVSQLHAVVATNRQDAAIREHVSRSIFRIHLDEPRAELLDFRDFESGAAGEPVPEEFAYSPFWEGRVLPDGSGLYQSWWGGNSPQTRVIFLDFTTGDVETVSTEFILPRAESERSSFGFTTTASNDGRRLIIISNDSGEVAIVDLIGRRIERTFPLDLGGVAGWQVQARSVHLSHDGRWMYLLDATAQWRYNPTPQPPETNPVWVVDLATWRLTHRIDVPGYVQSLHPDPDGDALRVLTQVANVREPQQWRFQLMTYATDDYALRESLPLSDLVEQNASFQLISASESYRQSYGHTPTVEGVAPGDVEEYTTLPRARVVTERELVPVGVTAPVELEFLDPASGEALIGPDPWVRFDPVRSRMLIFEQPGAKSLISVTADIAPGQLSGTV
ncbi:MAG TPA: hypothetical protein VKZ96_19975, partial [Thermomicrobiales bacterium]|nr:hypothetical protein [Thermomicrobiales bacterium]